MIKTYLVDTNYIIQQKEDLEKKLETSKVILLDSVLKELENLKRKNGSEDFFSQYKFANNNLDKFIYERSTGKYQDNDILEYCRFKKNKDIIVLTNDIGLQQQLNQNGIKYESGIKSDSFIDSPIIYSNEQNFEELQKNLAINQYIVCNTNGKEDVFYLNHNNELQRVKPKDIEIKIFKKRIKPQNLQQKLFTDQFFREEIEFICITGTAGSGKTFMALSQQLQYQEKNGIKNIYIQIPPIHIGGEDKYGFAPGTMEEKTQQYCGGFIDNLKFLSGLTEINVNKILFRDILVEITPLTTIRGRSLKDCVVILDEQQNQSKDEIIALLTRSDENSKYVFIGDVTQSDLKIKNIKNPFLETIKKFKNSKVFSYIKFENCLRSELANEQILRLL